MKEKLLQLLKTLYQSARKEFSERPIATTGVLATLLAVTIPLVLSRVLRGFVAYQVSELLRPKAELSLLPLAISLFALVLAACLPRMKKKESKGYIFIPFDLFTWKVKLHGNRRFTVDEGPYCKIHQVKFISADNDFYVCPICGSEDAIKLPYRRWIVLYDAVKNLAEAKLEDHIKADS